MLVLYLALGMLFTTIIVKKDPDKFKTEEIVIITALWLPIILIILTTED